MIPEAPPTPPSLPPRNSSMPGGFDIYHDSGPKYETIEELGDQVKEKALTMGDDVGLQYSTNNDHNQNPYIVDIDMPTEKDIEDAYNTNYMTSQLSHNGISYDTVSLSDFTADERKINPSDISDGFDNHRKPYVNIDETGNPVLEKSDFENLILMTDLAPLKDSVGETPYEFMETKCTDELAGKEQSNMAPPAVSDSDYQRVIDKNTV